MKFGFALVALLHMLQFLVDCTEQDVRTELIEQLKELKAQENQISITLSNPQVPTFKMHNNANCCVSVFRRILLDVLNNITLADNQDFIENIKDNVQVLSNGTKICPESEIYCKTITTPKSPFQQYINYLRKLNRRRRRSV